MPAHLSIKHLGFSSLALAPVTFSALLSFAAEPPRPSAPVQKYSIPPRPATRQQPPPQAAPPPKPAPLPKAAKPAAARKPDGKRLRHAALKGRRLARQQAALRGYNEHLRDARTLWARLVPTGPPKGEESPANSGAFSLLLDEERYPVLPALDGGRIILDGRGTFPAPVKSLMRETDPRVRVVSEQPGNSRRFYRSLLEAGRFNSVREDVVLEFDGEVKITLQADFEVERTSESLLHHESFLLNVAGSTPPAPAALAQFLARHGFTLLQSATAPGGKPANQNLLYQVAATEPGPIADAIMTALALRPQVGKKLPLYSKEQTGVCLEVPADRYFEDKGRRFAVFFNGASVTDTILELLAARGYRVILLEEGDELRDVADKILSQMGMPSGYQEHDLWAAREVGYGVRMSGIMVTDKNSTRKIFLTDQNLDPLVQELAKANGYRVAGK